MAIKIVDIPPEGLTLELSDQLDLFEQGTAGTVFTAELNIEPREGSMFHVAGRVRSEALLECSRCLKPFPYPIDAELDFDLLPPDAIGSSHEHELDQGELDTEFYDGDEIDPVRLIKEQLLLAIPMVPLHEAACKGLCPVCGIDRNSESCRCESGSGGKESAFSVLKDLFKDKKE